MSNRPNGTLYIGTTRNLEGRVFQHKTNDKVGSFTEKYHLKKLVHYEEYDLVVSGIRREKQMKKWRRSWKIKLIEEQNPNWDDLAADWFDGFPPTRE